jgi:hypothetical protein
VESDALWVDGFHNRCYLDSVKTTIDIPDQALADAMRFTGAKTKREAVVLAIEEFNRRQRVEAILAMAGTFPDFPDNEEIEAPETQRQELLERLRNGMK